MELIIDYYSNSSSNKYILFCGLTYNLNNNRIEDCLESNDGYLLRTWLATETPPEILYCYTLDRGNSYCGNQY